MDIYKFWYFCISLLQQTRYWLCFLIISRTRFRVNLHSIASISSNPFLETGVCLEQEAPWNWSRECRFTLKRVHDMIIKYSQIYRTDKYSQHKQNSIVWPVWLNGWVFVYKLSGYGFESRCCQIPLVLVNPFSTEKVEKLDFWNSKL